MSDPMFVYLTMAFSFLAAMIFVDLLGEKNKEEKYKNGKK